jgi:hypothetical protein
MEALSKQGITRTLDLYAGEAHCFFPYSGLYRHLVTVNGYGWLHIHFH